MACMYVRMLCLSNSSIDGLDAVQPSHPLSPLFLPALNLSQHQSLFPMNQFFMLGGQNNQNVSISPSNE